MKLTWKRIIAMLLLVSLALSVPAVSASASGEIITDPTGYTEATDVVYKKVGKYVANWGARGEDCVFLSSYAENYYVGNYSFEVLEGTPGGTSQSSAPNSSLYSALKNMMAGKHTYKTSYNGTKTLYCYTDCLKNNTDELSRFYDGVEVGSEWVSGGKTYNREHVWPKSKSPDGDQENDIMMLRPANPNDNGSRGNKAYGESSGYFDPGISVRGDCARILLYVYVRWGTTSTMWGKDGVIESLDLLLRWMEEDPVDTWEMGRNDAVQAITGVRNVFVDYPEFAWMLFGEEVPSGMVTPSGYARGEEEPTEDPTEESTEAPTEESTEVPTEVPTEESTEAPTEEEAPPTQCSHSVTEIRGAESATCTRTGYTGDTVCKLCGEPQRAGQIIPATGHKDENGDQACDSCSVSMKCTHAETEIRNEQPADCMTEGYTGDTCCKACGELLTAGTAIPATGHEDANGDLTCDSCSAELECTHAKTEIRDELSAGCESEGYTGDTYCATCGEKVETGVSVSAVGHKDENGDGACDTCTANLTVCAHGETEIRNIKHATCAEEGNTGDIYCKSCGELVESGSVIPVNDKHSYGHWEIVKEATASEEGSRKHTCVTCGHEETESIPTVDAPAGEMAPWVILLGGSLAGTAGYSYYRRKRKQ